MLTSTGENNTDWEGFVTDRGVGVVRATLVVDATGQGMSGRRAHRTDTMRRPGDVAQLGRAPGLQPGGRRFKSDRLHLVGALALAWFSAAPVWDSAGVSTHKPGPIVNPTLRVAAGAVLGATLAAEAVSVLAEGPREPVGARTVLVSGAARKLVELAPFEVPPNLSGPVIAWQDAAAAGR